VEPLITGCQPIPVKTNGREITEPFFEALTSHLLELIEKSGMRVHLAKETDSDKAFPAKLGGKMLAAYLARAYFETEVFIIGEGTTN
jgi:hypothetical protein